MDSVPAGTGVNPSMGDEGERPALAVGCFASICRDRLADELLTFSRICPQVDIGVHEMQRGALLPALRAGDLALAVLPGKEEPGLRSAEIWQGRVMVAMPRGHRLAGRASIVPTELAGEAVLVSRQQLGGDMHRFLAGLILPNGPALNATILDRGPARLMECVARGEGMALVCESHCALIGDTVAVRPVDAPGAAFPVRAYWTDAEPDWPVSALIQSLNRKAWVGNHI
jgi:DNA-binding transcriptional LysR family regulator